LYKSRELVARLSVLATGAVTEEEKYDQKSASKNERC